jgi:Zn ribbon nucleic-acid-binding protein
MTCQKIRPCPSCGRSGDDLDVFTYESGWRYVECVHCNYRGPGEGNIRQAIKSHNSECVRRAALRGTK